MKYKIEFYRGANDFVPYYVNDAIDEVDALKQVLPRLDEEFYVNVEDITPDEYMEKYNNIGWFAIDGAPYSDICAMMNKVLITIVPLDHLCMEDEILETLCELTHEDWVLLHNEYCKAANHPDERYREMEEFDEEYANMTPLEIAQDVHMGDFNPNMPLWYFDGNGNPCSCYWGDAPVCKGDIVRFMIRSGNNLGCTIIQPILDEMECE